MTHRISSHCLQLIMILLFTLSGCATKLAPNFDKALVNGLTTTNTGVMTFIASVDGGTENETYDQRKDNYAILIGQCNALEIQAKARPIPKNRMTEKINKLLEKRDIPAIDDSGTPSATAMKKISETLVKMRDTDKKQGITSYEVQAFKNQIAIYLDQALTYESFLER